jgi:hypothetical protein
MRFKWVGRYDPTMRMVRLCRLMWERGRVGDGAGYSAKLSLALRPSLLGFSRARDEWFVTFAGVRVHLQRSFGGIQV